MEKRRENFLKLIVENYVTQAEPIGSRFLVENCGLECSGATARNEMRALEEEGFLTHPHTSAGRIPTLAGYKYYVKNLLKPSPVSKKIKKTMEDVLAEYDEKTAVKAVGRLLSETAGAAVIVAWTPDSVYYTGMSNLFSQPEFKEFPNLINLSAVFDNCEIGIRDVWDEIERGKTKIFIGDENPLGENCALIASKGEKNGAMVSLIGPLRLNYDLGFGLINCFSKLI